MGCRLSTSRCIHIICLCGWGGGGGEELVSTSPTAIMRVMLDDACSFELGMYVCSLPLSSQLNIVRCCSCMYSNCSVST